MENVAALYLAISRGNANEVLVFLEAHPSLPTSVKEEAGKMLSEIADRSVWHRPEYHRIAKALTSAGVSCSIWDAARLGLLEVVQNWIAQDPVLLNAKETQGRTPLQRAALIYGTHNEAEAVVDFLITQGADVDLFTAATFSNLSAVRDALDRNPAAIYDRMQGSTALNWAVRPRTGGGRANVEAAVQVVRLLLEAGAAIDTKDEDEDSMQPLHHVAEWGSDAAPALAALLLENGADLNAESSQGWTPLDYASARGREPVVELLTRFGARKNTQSWPNQFGPERDLIITAAQQGDLATAKELLTKNPALTRARESNGATPLHWAAHNGHYEVAALLLSHGADITAQETVYWGGTPLHWASERQVALVELLLKQGAEVDSRNIRNRQTPLHFCARCDDSAEVAESLIRAGADREAKDNTRKTPLDYAEETKHLKVAACLKSAL